LPTEKTFGENVFDLFIRGLINTVEAIPQWLRGQMDMLYGYVKWLVGLSAGMIWQITALTVPFIPLILVFWTFDVTMTAVRTGSIQPIGFMFSTIWNFTVSLISAIVSVLQTIWSFIKFW
jgi:hypothetical protein